MKIEDRVTWIDAFIERNSTAFTREETVLGLMFGLLNNIATDQQWDEVAKQIEDAMAARNAPKTDDLG